MKKKKKMKVSFRETEFDRQALDNIKSSSSGLLLYKAFPRLPAFHFYISSVHQSVDGAEVLTKTVLMSFKLK